MPGLSSSAHIFLLIGISLSLGFIAYGGKKGIFLSFFFCAQIPFHLISGDMSKNSFGAPRSTILMCWNGKNEMNNQIKGRNERRKEKRREQGQFGIWVHQGHCRIKTGLMRMRSLSNDENVEKERETQ